MTDIIHPERVLDPRFLECIDYEDENWRECRFVGGRGPDGFRIAWSPPQFVDPETQSAYSAAWDWGAIAACDFISYLREETQFDTDHRLIDVVEAMTGKELGNAERAFFRALSAFIGRGRIQAAFNFDLVPSGLPSPSEGEAA